MRKIIITMAIASLISFTAMAQEERKVAVFDPAGNADNSVKEIVREVISSVVVNTNGYTVLERQLIDRVLAENRFQMGGLVDDAQISEMGRMIGANLVFVTSVITMDNNFFISGKIVDVQTARIEMQRTSETQNGTRDLVAVVQRLVGDILRQPATSATPTAPTQQTRQVQTPSQTVAPATTQQTIAATGALISVGQKVYQLDREFSQSEFNRFMNLKLYRTGQLSQNSVQSLMARSSDFALATYNKGLKTNRTGDWLVVTVIPAILPSGFIVKSHGNMQIREAVHMYNRSINQCDVSQMIFNYNYDKGSRINKIGNILTFPGAGVTLIGGWILPRYVFPLDWSGYDEDEISLYWNPVFGTICLAIGGAMLFTGIHLKISGKHLMRQSAVLHNSGGNRTGMELDFGVSGNGAGMFLRF